MSNPTDAALNDAWIVPLMCCVESIIVDIKMRLSLPGSSSDFSEVLVEKYRTEICEFCEEFFPTWQENVILQTEMHKIFISSIKTRYKDLAEPAIINIISHEINKRILPSLKNMSKFLEMVSKRHTES